MTELGDYLRAQKAAGLVWAKQAELDALRASPRGQLLDALRTAIGHLEHMAAFISKQEAGYSFESLGEDLPGMRALISGSRSDGLPLVKIEHHVAGEAEDVETVGWRYIVSPFLSYWVGEVSRDLFEKADCEYLGTDTGIFLVRYNDLAPADQKAVILARCPDWDRGREVAVMLSGAQQTLTSPPASAEVVERAIAESLPPAEPVVWKAMAAYLACPSPNMADAMRAALQASGAAVQVPEDMQWFDWPTGEVQNGRLYLAELVPGGKPILVAVEAAGEEVSFYHHEKDQYLTIEPLRLKWTGETF